MGRRISLLDRSGIPASIGADWIWLPLHESSGTTVTNKSGKLVTAAKSVAGTTTGIWASPGWFTAAADTYIRLGLLQDFCRLDTLTGSLLIAFDFWLTANPTANEYILSHSINDNATGGYGIRLQTDGKIALAWRAVGATSVSSYAITPVAANVVKSARNSLMYVFHMTDGALSVDCYLNGELAVSDAPTGTLPQLHNMRELTLCATSAATPATFLSGTGSGGRIANVLMLRSSSRLTNQVVDVAEQLWRYPGDLPHRLRGVA